MPPRLPSRPPCEAGELATLFKVGAIDASDLRCRNKIFVVVTPSERDEGRKRADAASRNHPPDMPDQRKARDRGEEGAYKSGRRVPGHFNVAVVRLALVQILSHGIHFHRPVGIPSA